MPVLLGAILANAGIQVVLTGVRHPRMNAIVERRIRTCRRELLDRPLLWHRLHPLRALRAYENFDNTHRTHQGIIRRRHRPGDVLDGYYAA